MAETKTNAEVSNPGKPTLHHLDHSQSQRILWLLEELSIPYNLVLYKRDENKRSPPELSKVHPLGRSPVLITPDGKVLTESMTIATYLLETYDPSKKFASNDWIRDMTLTSFSGTSLLDLADTELLFDLAAKHTPWPFVYITRKIKKSYDSFFSAAEFKKDMEFLTQELGEQEWFNGKEPGRADFMLSWPMDMIAARGYVDFEKDWKTLHAWRMRILARPAWKSAIDKGEGYDLRSW
ncbi:thioredoxin-like protein [Mollisia scopiformis]|uniref:Thioredoxin-like protein n=1 Tax=Mollisia scopiformis TaxID=149040 RepID=A0A194XBZ1_MOLSC|nr:thioredoxin-like protein [Mollisia scopiformis]KUJ17676.1 thioredoxin-like protein [Mollisia scopiformis]